MHLKKKLSIKTVFKAIAQKHVYSKQKQQYSVMQILNGTVSQGKMNFEPQQVTHIFLSIPCD